MNETELIAHLVVAGAYTGKLHKPCAYIALPRFALAFKGVLRTKHIYCWYICNHIHYRVPKKLRL